MAYLRPTPPDGEWVGLGPELRQAGLPFWVLRSLLLILASPAGVVGKQQVKQLPLNGRSWAYSLQRVRAFR